MSSICLLILPNKKTQNHYNIFMVIMSDVFEKVTRSTNRRNLKLNDLSN